MNTDIKPKNYISNDNLKFLAKEISNIENRFNQITQTEQNLVSIISNISDKLIKFQEIITQNENDISLKEIKIGQLINENDYLTEDNAKLKNVIQENENNIISLNDKIDEINKKYFELEEEKYLLKKELKEKEEKIEELNQILDEEIDKKIYRPNQEEFNLLKLTLHKLIKKNEDIYQEIIQDLTQDINESMVKNINLPIKNENENKINRNERVEIDFISDLENNEQNQNNLLNLDTEKVVNETIENSNEKNNIISEKLNGKIESQKKLIADIIKLTEDGIKRPVKYKKNIKETKINENLIKKSIELKKELVTETLAELYAQQSANNNNGAFNKAIEAYKTLSKKFPERKSYYERKIEELESLRKNIPNINK